MLLKKSDSDLATLYLTKENFHYIITTGNISCDFDRMQQYTVVQLKYYMCTGNIKAFYWQINFWSHLQIVCWKIHIVTEYLWVKNCEVLVLVLTSILIKGHNIIALHDVHPLSTLSFLQQLLCSTRKWQFQGWNILGFLKHIWQEQVCGI